jgi:acetyl esterase/lipase
VRGRGYRLSGFAPFLRQIRDVKAVNRWLRADAVSNPSLAITVSLF